MIGGGGKSSLGTDPVFNSRDVKQKENTRCGVRPSIRILDPSPPSHSYQLCTRQFQ